MNRIPIRLFFIFCLLFANLFIYSQNENNFQISKSISVYANLLKELNINYVDEINPENLSIVSINALLNKLDPYTVFFSEDEAEHYEMMTTGSYGGIGVLMHENDGKIFISEVYEDFSAYKAGLKTGDIITHINNESIIGKSSSQISDSIRGHANTKLSITVSRLGHPEPLTMELFRESIKLKNVPFYTLLDDNIAYVKQTGFTENAAGEVKNALLSLKNEKKINGLILDLRNNGGGLMHEAIEIVNFFVEKDQEVVSTKGKTTKQNAIHKTKKAPVDKSTPIVILINYGTASAAEIVTGAIQDLDRGVIMGQQSYGKGLIQNFFSLGYNSRAKITVGKYYIPSGRCIQAIDYSNDSTKTADSLKNTEFYTKAGRRVYEGNGIDPDIEIEELSYHNISRSLFEKFLLFDYATKFYAENNTIPPAKDFEITEEIYADFLAFIADKEYDYTTESEQTLEDLKKHAEKEKYFDAIKEQYAALQKAMMHDKQADLVKFKNEIKELLKMEIVSRYYYQKGRIEASVMADQEIKEAVKMLKDEERYQATLSPVSAEKPQLTE